MTPNEIATQRLTSRSAALIGRVARVLRVDRTVFAEIKADSTATGQAWAVVGGSALTTALGSIGPGVSGAMRPGDLLLDVVDRVVATVIGFVIWSGVVHVVGSRLFPGTASLGEVIRVLGFTVAPQLFAMLGLLPVLGLPLRLLLVGWTALLGVMALHQVLKLDTPKAMLTVVLGGSVVALCVLGSLVVGGLLAIALGLGTTSLIGERR